MKSFLDGDALMRKLIGALTPDVTQDAPEEVEV